MTSTLDLGSNYTLEESSNGNLLIKDSTGTVVLKHADGGDFSLGAALELGDLVDGSTGDTVYDGSTETLGNGTQDADLQSVKTAGLEVTTEGEYIGDINANTEAFLNKNVQLDFDYQAFDDLPNWVDQTIDNVVPSLQGNPRDLVLSVSDGSSNDWGGVRSTVPVSAQNLGAFEISFEIVENPSFAGANVGLIASTMSQNAAKDQNNPVAAVFALGADKVAYDGNRFDFTFSTPETLMIRYDGSDITFEGSADTRSFSYSTQADFRPALQLQDNGTTSLEISDVSVTPQ